MVTQVINKRLELNMSLGMDVTSYYGVQKYEGNLTKVDLNDETLIILELLHLLGFLLTYL